MSLVKVSKIQKPEDIRDALCFNGEPQGYDLIALYDKAIKMGSPYTRGDLRVAWKIAQDPYYWRAFKEYESLQTLVDAGFFDDGLEPGVLAGLKDPHILSTPLNSVISQVEKLKEERNTKPLVVLLTSGCFAPVHDGHIAMMETAKQEMEAQGYAVVGGFFSPAHDEYVSTKGDDARRLTIAHRVLLLDKVLQSKDWLNVDPWAARFIPTDINFTDTIQRLEHYMNAHIKTEQPIQVAYVCGADNIQFTKTFVRNGLGVCVKRPGYEANFKEMIDEVGMKNNPHMIFGETNEGVNLSSSDVREGKLKANVILEKDLSYQELLKGVARHESQQSVARKHNYLIRDDLKWATKQWRDKVDNDVLDKAINDFKKGLIRAIENAFERSKTTGYPDEVRALLLSVEEQEKIVTSLQEKYPNRVLNNDVITNGDQKLLSVSRLFDVSTPQFYSNQLIERETKQTSFQELEKGEYVFVDDDIATGATADMIAEKLPDGVSITKRISLAEEAFKQSYPNDVFHFWDIIDARDFLLGSKNGGLVTQLFNGNVGRSPYMLPYVSVVNRCKIPPDQETSFTQEIRLLNEKFFRDIWVDLKLADVEPEFQNVMHSVGFRPQTRMSDIASWHLSLRG